ncbi:MAG: extracellular solute-binding protein [Phormidesmis sp. RL_2_1]|nr:extracellular solute-binding protein [Phormidesmis sp. RL_2_1]
MDNGSISLSIDQLVSQFAAPFAQLQQQVKTYDSANQLKALVNEDVKAVVAWSSDVVTALDRYRDLKMVLPEEGSLLSADMWVRPKGAQMSPLAQQWIDFCWQTEAATPKFLLPVGGIIAGFSKP